MTPSSSRKRQRLPLLALMTLALALVTLLATPAAASQGDRSPEYRHCVDSCQKDSCSSNPEWDDGTARTTKLPLMLRLMGWNCLDDCRYHCTHRVTNDAFERVRQIKGEIEHQVESGNETSRLSASARRAEIDERVRRKLETLRPVQREMVQFHGKWVFVRLLGAQEPASVIFSLLNFNVHRRAVARIRKQVPDSYPLKVPLLGYALVSCNAWIWSSVFHSRDKAWTERLDYFGAGAAVLSALFVSLCRLVRLSPRDVRFRQLLQLCLAALTCHIVYLSIGRFDYGYNMTANVLVGVAHTLLWLTYSLKPEVFPSLASSSSSGNNNIAMTSPRSAGGADSPPPPVSAPEPSPPSSSRAARTRLQLILASLVAATCLELFDFPPFWRAFDAHSLWHLATIPLSELWYSWLIADARECVSSGWWAGEGLKDPTLQMAPHVALAMDRAKGWAVEMKDASVRAVDTATEVVQRAPGGHIATDKAASLSRGISSWAIDLWNDINGHYRTVAVKFGMAEAQSDREKEKARELGDRGVV